MASIDQRVGSISEAPPIVQGGRVSIGNICPHGISLQEDDKGVYLSRTIDDPEHGLIKDRSTVRIIQDVCNQCAIAMRKCGFHRAHAQAALESVEKPVIN